MTQTQYPFLNSGGEMGALTRSFDWSTTPIGMPDAWPQSLRTVVGILLHSRFPMFLFWGPGYTCFYNDACRPSLSASGKHPIALGQRGEMVWPEIWHVIKPLIDSVMAGGEASWSEDQLIPIYRNGSLENVYWTFSYSSVIDESGHPAGVFVTCTETTGKLASIKELQESKEELEFAIEATGLGTWDLDPVTGHLKANDRLKDWFGLRPDEEVPLALAIAAIAEEDRQRVIDTINAALQPGSGGHYKAAYNIVHPQTGRWRAVVAKGIARFSPNGKAYRLSGTLQDVTEEQIAMQRIASSQRELLASFEESPVAIATLSKESLTFRMVNSFYAELVGRRPEDLIDKPLLEALPEIAGQGFVKLLEGVIDTGVPYTAKEVAVELRRAGNLETVYVDLTCQPRYDGGNNQIIGVLVMVVDVTGQVLARRRIEASEARFRSLIQEAPVGTCLYVGRELRIEIANDIIMDYWGKGRDVVGKTMLEAHPEMRDQPFPRILDEVFTTGNTFEQKAVRAEVMVNGKLQTYYFDLTYKPLRNAEGAVYAILDVAVDVTGQVLARQQLEASETKLRGIISSAPAGIGLFVGRDLIIENPNQTFINIVGKGPDIEGRPLREVMPELITEGQPFLQILDDVYTTGKMFQSAASLVKIVQNGVMTNKYYNITHTPVFNGGGQVYAVLDIAVDVTDQIKAQQALEESELFTRSIIDNSPVAKVVFIGEDMTISLANQNMLEMLGRDASIIGKPLMEAMPQLAATPLMERLRHVYTTGETFIQPEQKLQLIKDRQPHTGYYNYIYKALCNRAGDIYGIIFTATEVTEQVVARQQLEDAESTLRDAVELAELATWGIDMLTGAITYSQRLKNWLGIETVMISDEEAAARIHPKDRERIGVAIFAALTPGSTGRYDEIYTIIHSKTGREHIIHAIGKAVFSEQGIPLSISGTVQDITIQQQHQLALEAEVLQRTGELAAAVSALQATNEELAELNTLLTNSNDELAQYAYVASHDLQEPLRKIRIFSGLLSNQPGLPEAARDTVEKITGSASRMSLLIKDLLEFSRLLKTDTLMRPVALGEVLQAVISDFELTIAEKEAVVEAGGLPVIEAVALQMNQLFFNLLSNALKFSRPGTPPLVRIAAQPISQEEAGHDLKKLLPFAQYYHITIADNGIGFDTQYSEQIFEVFKRLHGRDHYPGSGIGLALCRRIAGNHNGALYAESQPGLGTTFHIVLPGRQHEEDSIIPERFSLVPAP